MSTREEWLERVGVIRTWRRGDQRAPHKPLLLLYILGRLQRTGTTEVTYVEAEPELEALLRDFGPPNPTSPAYPFHHLQTDGLWQVEGNDAGASAVRLRDTNAVGRLEAGFEAALRDDPGLVALIGRFLLDSNFPESLHSELGAAAGLNLEQAELVAAQARVRELRRRDPRFREMVLVAYEFQCAMCGYDGRIGAESVGLDAAHVRWWAFDGPDTVDNALCLCSFHHKLLDRGVLGITTGRAIAVSTRFVGRGEVADQLVLKMVGRDLLLPQSGQPQPDALHISWHRREVFRDPPRVAA